MMNPFRRLAKTTPLKFVPRDLEKKNNCKEQVMQMLAVFSNVDEVSNTMHISEKSLYLLQRRNK